MAVQLNTVNLRDTDVQEFQRNVAAAVSELSDAISPSVGVIGPITSSRKLVGNEEVVLVDASQSTTEIALLLPGVKALKRAVTFKVTRAGSSAVRIKAVDVASPSTPAINGSASVTIPAGEEGNLTVVTDGRNYWSW